MFFVFGPGGQMFRGSLERLSQVARVRRIQRPQALRTRATGADTSGDAPGFTSALAQAEHPNGPAAAASPAQPQISAAHGKGVAQAYQSTARGPRQPRQLLHTVAHAMTSTIITVEQNAGVNDAWRKLAEQGVAQAPVLDGQGLVIGLLLRADMAPLDLLPEPGHIAQAIALARRPVHEVMISPIPTVSPDTELRRVARVLLDTGLPGLPVTDELGSLLGFISRTDILRAVATDPPLDLWT
ncbi:CBS domain-containing protein [Comamonas composti]|uniref:CBS domain-containing protein n=1 Tax=Comamonas composti TaxID=408558 RepID=UPI000424871E|nr:CBS domain-containing protein [Comamonas composti]